MKTRLTLPPLVVAALAALALAASSAAATIDDLRAIGFQVEVARTYTDPGSGQQCVVYDFEGFGVSEQASSCDPGFQAFVDALANPAAQCNRAWQHDHPDQYAAFESLLGKGYVISGDQCADHYVVTNPVDGSTPYDGTGAGLVGFDAQQPPAADVAQAQAGRGAAASGSGHPPQTCLPLCSTPAGPDGDGSSADTTGVGADPSSASVADSASEQALAQATDQGADPAEAALAARSAALNVTYGLGGA